MVSSLQKYTLQEQVISLASIPGRGSVLDLGGGGEGIVSLLAGNRVVALDPRLDELQETSYSPRKTAADGRFLPFPAHSFQAVTSFFTLMYVPAVERPALFREVWRVLEPGGHFMVWDAIIPPAVPGMDLFIVPLRIQLAAETIETTYGVRWEGKQLSLQSCASCLEEIGFQNLEAHRQGDTFRAVCHKPFNDVE